MDTWVKTINKLQADRIQLGFNPCFNGYMGKDPPPRPICAPLLPVSILVLMDTWVKTLVVAVILAITVDGFNPCFNGYMGKDQQTASGDDPNLMFQSLF